MLKREPEATTVPHASHFVYFPCEGPKFQVPNSPGASGWSVQKAQSWFSYSLCFLERCVKDHFSLNFSPLRMIKYIKYLWLCIFQSWNPYRICTALWISYTILRLTSLLHHKYPIVRFKPWLLDSFFISFTHGFFLVLAECSWDAPTHLSWVSLMSKGKAAPPEHKMTRPSLNSNDSTPLLKLLGSLYYLHGLPIGGKSWASNNYKWSPGNTGGGMSWLLASGRPVLEWHRASN